MNALKITQIGNSLGVILPKELIAKLGLAKGDALFVNESPDGFTARRTDPAFEDQMQVLRDVMKRRRAALRELAK